LKEIKEEIHAMIYCIKYESRTFLDKEDDVINELYKQKIKIIFVFTKGERETSSNFRRFKSNFMNDLKDILKKKKIKNNNLENDIKIVSIYSMKEEKNGHIVEPFGIDTLFEIIHNSLKDKKIPEYLLKLIKDEYDEEKINELIESTYLEEICKSRKELIEAIRKKVSIKISLFLGKFIMSCQKYGFMDPDDIFLSLWSDINGLIYELSCAYCKTLDKDESLVLMNKIAVIVKDFVKEGFDMQEDEKYQELKENLTWYMRILGIILSPLVIIAGGAAATILSGKIKKLIYQEFEKEGNINLRSYLSLFAEGINEGIDGLQKIIEEFKISYNGH